MGWKSVVRWAWGVVVVVVVAPGAGAAIIGIDAVHGFDPDTILATGEGFETFREVIRERGNTVVGLTRFDADALAPLDGVILNTPYRVNDRPYTAAEESAVRGFARTAVFVSDTALWREADGVSDRPITFGDNQHLLENIVDLLALGGGVLVTGDGGTGFDVDNLNGLVAPFGITYAHRATEGSGHTTDHFLVDPLTAGLDEVGIDYQLRITATAPAHLLTLGAPADHILAVAGAVPEPTSLTLLLLPLTALVARRRRARLGGFRGQSCSKPHAPRAVLRGRSTPGLTVEPMTAAGTFRGDSMPPQGVAHCAGPSGAGAARDHAAEAPDVAALVPRAPRPKMREDEDFLIVTAIRGENRGLDESWHAGC